MTRTGPRGEHSRDEFLTLVLDAAENFAREEGLSGLGMRRIAAAIGYAPNSIYNALGGLDDIILGVNTRTLTRFHSHLQDLVAEKRSLRARILRLADGYLDFAAANPKLWSLLFEHRMPPDTTHPDWYAENLRQAVGLMDESLAPLLANAADRHRAVVALWAALHGLAALAISGTLEVLSRDDPRRLARVLIGGLLDAMARTGAEVHASPDRVEGQSG